MVRKQTSVARNRDEWGDENERRPERGDTASRRLSSIKNVVRGDTETLAQQERALAGRVTFVEQPHFIEGDTHMITAQYNPTEIGARVLEILKQCDGQYGTNNAWACIRWGTRMNARQLAEKHGKLPSGKSVSVHFSSYVPESGIVLWLDGGLTRDEYEDEQVREEHVARRHMQALAEQIRALGVDCVIQE